MLSGMYPTMPPPRFGQSTQKPSNEALKQRFTQDRDQLWRLMKELEPVLQEGGLLPHKSFAVAMGLLGGLKNMDLSTPIGIVIWARAEDPDAKQAITDFLTERKLIQPVPNTDYHQYKGALLDIANLPAPTY